jgi:hypothetical protein
MVLGMVLGLLTPIDKEATRPLALMLVLLVLLLWRETMVSPFIGLGAEADAGAMINGER